MYMIEMCPKVWRTKPRNHYVPLDYNRDDVYKRVFDVSHYGKIVFSPKARWSDKHRDNIIAFDKETDTVKFIKISILARMPA